MATATAVEAPKPVKKKKKTAARRVSLGCAYVQATFNNTIVSLTDTNGNVLTWSSAGACGFKGPKKATPYAAGVIVKTVAEKVKDFGLKELHVFVKGAGSGRDAAIRALNANGFTILSLKDQTPLPHNGCRPRRARRV